jgi:hypothetical protein
MCRRCARSAHERYDGPSLPLVEPPLAARRHLSWACRSAAVAARPARRPARRTDYFTRALAVAATEAEKPRVSTGTPADGRVLGRSVKLSARAVGHGRRRGTRHDRTEPAVLDAGLCNSCSVLAAVALVSSVVLIATSSGGDPATPLYQRFLTSAGFGGLMAVVAATIAATIAFVQFQHTKRKAADDRWWDTLTWVYDRSIVEPGAKPALPQTVTFAMLSALSEEAAPERQGRLRGESISAVLSMFEGTSPATATGQAEPQDEVATPGLDEAAEQALIPVAEPDAARLLEQLRLDLTDQGYGQVFNRLAQGREYESAVLESLGRLVAASSSTGLSVQSEVADVGFDATIRGDGGVILVMIKHTRKTIIPSLAADWAHRLRRSGPFPKGDDPGGAVIVANQPLTRTAAVKLDEVGNGRVLHVLWRNQEDDVTLLRALTQLGLPPEVSHGERE